MELLITLGRDSVVAYQNEANAKINVLPLGTSISATHSCCPLRKSAIRFSAARRSAFRTARFSLTTERS
jgi:hypothetical protein